MTAPKVALSVAELVPRFKEEQVFIIEAFLVHSFRESGRKGVVLGLSGGVGPALLGGVFAGAPRAPRVFVGPLAPGGSGDGRRSTLYKDLAAYGRHCRPRGGWAAG